ncbi:MAG: glycosyltransferase family 4 protein [Verrucomicrobiales bacterium]
MTEASADSRPVWKMITREMPSRFATGKNRRLATLAEGLIEAGIALECHYTSNSHDLVVPHDPELWAKLDRVISWRIDPSGEEPAGSEEPVEGIVYRSVNHFAASFADEFTTANLEGVLFTSLELVSSLWKRIPPGVLKVLDGDEMESGRTQEFARIEYSIVSLFEKRSFVAKAMLEKMWIPKFDLVTLSSAKELEKAVAWVTDAPAQLTVWPNIAPEAEVVLEREVAETLSLFFVGHLGYPPNQDGLIWFLKEVFPLILKRYPDASLQVIGQRCPDSLIQLLNRPGVTYLGAQPSLETFYASATAAIVPLRAGTGTRIKILEAFSRSCPVVSTSKGAEGLEVRAGKELLIADDPEKFAEGCFSLHEDHSLGETLAEEARRFWKSGFTRETLNRVIADSIHRLRRTGNTNGPPHFG